MTSEQNVDRPRRHGAVSAARVLAFTVTLGAFVGLAVAAGLHTGALHHVDMRVDDWVNRRVAAPHRAVVRTAELVSTIAGPATWRVLAAITAIVLCVRRRLREAALVVVAFVAAAVLSDVVKSGVGRPRPTVPIPVEHAGGASFPSSHALTSATAAAVAIVLTAALLPECRRALRLLVVVSLAVIALLVAASRIVLGVHYPTDVVGGWLLAALIVSTATTILRVRRCGSTTIP